MINLINCPSLPKKPSFRKADPGDKKKPTYKYVYDEKYGCPRRVLVGYVDLDEFIQQSADDIDFKTLGKQLIDTKANVISHFEMNGEVFDQTALPRDVREYEALYNKIQGEFDKLPSDMKELFGNDVGQFRSAWMNGSIGSILDAHYKAVASTQSQTGTEIKEGE